MEKKRYQPREARRVVCAPAATSAFFILCLSFGRRIVPRQTSGSSAGCAQKLHLTTTATQTPHFPYHFPRARTTQTGRSAGRSGETENRFLRRRAEWLKAVSPTLYAPRAAVPSPAGLFVQTGTGHGTGTSQTTSTPTPTLTLPHHGLPRLDGRHITTTTTPPSPPPSPSAAHDNGARPPNPAHHLEWLIQQFLVDIPRARHRRRQRLLHDPSQRLTVLTGCGYIAGSLLRCPHAPPV